MDIVTLAMAKAYTDSLKESGGAGYTDPARVIPYDIRNATEEEIILGAFVKIADEPIDLTKVSEITASDGEGGTVTLTKEMFEVRPLEVLKNTPCLWFTAEGQNLPLMCVVEGGTIIATIFDFGSIKLAETIHTIDPKFIPWNSAPGGGGGGGLPVVDLTGCTDGEITDAQIIATLDAMKENTVVFIGEISLAGAIDTVLFKRMMQEDNFAWYGTNFLSAVTPGATTSVGFVDGKWTLFTTAPTTAEV